jgi:SAM-dependent methyltransferase
MALYDHEFYSERHTRTRHAAEVVLAAVMQDHPGIRSAVDVGCGVGTWLRVLKEKGVAEVRGVDGPWVEPDLLEIPKADFLVHDLATGGRLDLGRRFDLAICLEVGEHLAGDRAEDFVGLLCGLADVVLFSAAVPGQGGIGHVNEQWPAYWTGLFDRRGFEVSDTIRPRIWTDEAIPWLYRQNVLLFTARGRVARPEAGVPGFQALPMVFIPTKWRARFYGSCRSLGSFR